MKHARKVKIKGEIWKYFVIEHQKNGDSRVRFHTPMGFYVDWNVESTEPSNAFIKAFVLSHPHLFEEQEKEE